MAQVSGDVAAALSDGRRASESVEDWLKRQRQETAPHPLEVELEKIQQVLEALEECLPRWWADRLLRGGPQLF